MAQQRYSKILQRTALSAALGLCFASASYAQSNAAGAIRGSAAPGDTITITNPNTGFTRTISASADGSYRFSALPTGEYVVTRVSDDGASMKRTTNVRVGTATNVDFVRGGAPVSLETITVLGVNQINPIDVSSVESSTILTAEQIKKIPVPENLTAVALLAPGTVRGDNAFGNLASFGGSSVAENQYYVNGFIVTNTYKNLDFIDVPFEAIAEQQVKTGGYGAEFGRSTGGVVNQITKRGTNTFHAGGEVEWSPESLNEVQPNTYRNDGTLVSNNSKDNGDSKTYTVWASGALIEDTLFAYGLLEYRESDFDSYGSDGGGGDNVNQTSEAPNWVLKLDWNINDSNILEFTGIGDSVDTETDFYETTFQEPFGTPNRVPYRGDYRGTNYAESGGEAYILKYTGYLTDALTLSALYGHSDVSRGTYDVSASGVVTDYGGDINEVIGGCPQVIDARADVRNGIIPAYNSCNLSSTIGRSDAGDVRNQFRIDAEWLLGDHLIRGGIDTDDFESKAGSARSGGHIWVYLTDTIGLDYVITQGATVEVKQQAFYIEDHWSVTDNFLLYGGLRWDSFDNRNGEGETYVEINNQFAPRLGFSWDVNGDSSFKVFGTAGRYALPLASTVAVRGASESYLQYQYYTYNGVDPVTGAPIDVAYITDPVYLNNEFGEAHSARSIASKNLEPMYQDEYILGFQTQLTDNITMGARGIYRDLKRAIDDTCDYRAVIAWALDNGFVLDPSGNPNQRPDPNNPLEISYINPGFPACRLFNPGQEGIYEMDVNGDGVFEMVTISAEAFDPTGTIPMAAAKRTYAALEIFGQASWDNFFVQGSYTYSKNKGNTEGGVKSDIGQADTGVTQDFDYPELTIGSYGYLPNDRRHALKVFGSWSITDEWLLGVGALVKSGRPINCIGVYGDDPTGYGNSYFSCDDAEITDTDDPSTPDINEDPTPGNENNGYTTGQRGDYGTTPWTRTVNLNLRYMPHWAEGLTLKMDVYNVFDADGTIQVNEAGETSQGNPDPNNFLRTTSYQTARSVKFTARYEF